MKKYLYIGIITVFAVLTIFCIGQHSASIKYKKLYEKELQNVEAYRISNAGLQDKAVEYQMTIEELYNSKDSLDKKIVAMMQQLNIESDKVKELQYQLKTINKVDTIIIIDTIFKEGVSVDTTIGDYWYNLNLQLRYPSTIITKPVFNSEQYVYIYSKKEYVGGKSKCFLINWFKKKYIKTEIEIKERNPYINTIEQKFININTN